MSVSKEVEELIGRAKQLETVRKELRDDIARSQGDVNLDRRHDANYRLHNATRAQRAVLQMLLARLGFPGRTILQ